MALKRKTKVNEAFSMASMTDVIFLLLIFFMVVSTLVVPNAIKVNLPSSQSTAPSEMPMVRLTLTAEGRCYIVTPSAQTPQEVTIDLLAEQLIQTREQTPDMLVALYADEEVPYREIVKILNITAQLDLKLVLATKALQAKD
ncbi:ExbD/TolR family protein [Porphyromonas circumdentaria]|uniref:Biopolymer transport protein ExbD n=1 Tax=Porphyromonas circumdentaria TaxID=29524 RepID=A0A1T4MKQ7_9PORP|nr:biopolymer transporter ExbD [Porphyromonas circumdentaria]MBB6275845.1 biopolymer transport protein ExbD [Porphyromonas circumdentaria]MDO4722389.1 biopolymer transporter ExbD [Porphyromonas circumdentaria]SJZ67426.1 biopolymer transport protein ExbD [Porphyromonas circumdentaria]